MKKKQETYGLPDETLQLIAASPELSFLLSPDEGAMQVATPGLRRSDLISALRSISAAENAGFNRFDNLENDDALDINLRQSRGANNPSRLSMKYIAPAVELPGAETQPPYVPPYVPRMSRQAAAVMMAAE